MIAQIAELIDFIPENVLDVGAYRGEWTRLALRRWPHAHYTLVEAAEEQCRHCRSVLHTAQFDVHCVVAHSHDGDDVRFYKSQQFPTGNSIYEETTAWWDGVATNRKGRRLDSVFPDGKFDLIKIDVQGAELDVLKGMPLILSRAKALVIEVMMGEGEYNRGAPRGTDVFDWL